MAGVSQKTFLKTINGTPEKRVFLSIINDYGLQSGICELIDNALDLWLESGRTKQLNIDVTLDTDRQVVQVRDNAGGVRVSDARLLIAPGASRESAENELIGIFGVGGKRAGVALGEHIEIRTRSAREKSLLIELTSEWLHESDDWNLEIFEIPDIEPGTTTVEISKIRQGFSEGDVDDIRQHFGEIYSWFIKEGCVLKLNRHAIVPIVFNKWAYPPDYLPRRAQFSISPTSDGMLSVTLTAGLIRDRVPDADNYGAYFYCNHRLIEKEVQSRDVGFISGEAGVPHPDASLCRVIVELIGLPDLMPWTSSKDAINFSHPALIQIRKRIIDFASYYSSVSRRLKRDWDDGVFRFTRGEIETVDSTEALSEKKKVLPKLPRKRRLTRIDELKIENGGVLNKKPWTLGLVEAMGLIEIISRQRLQTGNRVSLILLDSNFEIALKEFIVNRKDLFPAHKWNNAALATLFARRTNVIREVQQHAKFSKTLLTKVNHYYTLRNSLIHERATQLITNDQVEDYRLTIELVLKKLFGLKFPER